MTGVFSSQTLRGVVLRVRDRDGVGIISWDSLFLTFFGARRTRGVFDPAGERIFVAPANCRPWSTGNPHRLSNVRISHKSVSYPSVSVLRIRVPIYRLAFGVL